MVSLWWELWKLGRKNCFSPRQHFFGLTLQGARAWGILPLQHRPWRWKSTFVQWNSDCTPFALGNPFSVVTFELVCVWRTWPQSHKHIKTYSLHSHITAADTPLPTTTKMTKEEKEKKTPNETKTRSPWVRAQYYIPHTRSKLQKLPISYPLNSHDKKNTATVNMRKKTCFLKR